MIKILTYEQYIAFLLLFAAYSDQKLSHEEITQILNKITQKEFREMNGYFLSLNNYEQLNVIEHHKKEYLDTPEKINQALTDISGVLSSEKKFGPMQQYYYNFLHKKLTS